MTTEQQLQVCSTCKNKKVGKDYETVCGLTNAKPDFGETCPTYNYADAVASDVGSGSVNPWRIGLSLLVAIIAIVRLGVTCNRMDDRRHGSNNGQNMEQLLRDIKSENRDQMLALSKEDQALLGINLLERDSTVRIDKMMDFTIPRGQYLMENLLNDTIPIMIRDSKNFMTILYRFDKSDHPEEDWRRYRLAASNQVLNTDVTYDKVGDNTFDYELNNSMMETKGRAKVFSDSKYNYVFQCEHPFNTPEKVKAYFAAMEVRCIHLNN